MLGRSASPRNHLIIGMEFVVVGGKTGPAAGEAPFRTPPRKSSKHRNIEFWERNLGCRKIKPEEVQEK